MDFWLNTSIKKIREASTSWGIIASTTGDENYSRVFTRDAVIGGIVGILVKDETIISSLFSTIDNLSKLQGSEGQIPSNYSIKDNKIDKISFGTLSPKIDSCTWYLIGLSLLIKEGIVIKEDVYNNVKKTISLLEGIEFNGKGLMYIPRGGNWADEYIYDGYILYDQILRIWALKQMANIYGDITWEKKAESILSKISNYESLENDFYVSSFRPGGKFEKFDLPAHALLGIVINEKTPAFNKAFEWICNSFLKKGNLPSAFYPIIEKTDKDFKELQNFYLYRFKNNPGHFHNGGIWWVWLGWYAISLSLNDRQDDLDLLLKLSFDYLNSVRENFEFDEYISLPTKKLSGTKDLVFTASGIALLSLARTNFKFAELKPSYNNSLIESLEIKNEYFRISKELVQILEQKSLFEKKKIVISIAGESGSGKSVTAKCLQIELEKLNIKSIILHQDGYFKLPPKENHNKRKKDLSWVGIKEIEIEKLQSTINKFKNNSATLEISSINYRLNKFIHTEVLSSEVPILIVEGVYAFELKNSDFKIFMSRTYEDTIDKRKSRMREEYDPFVEKVLEIEHLLIKNKRSHANIVIAEDYTIESEVDNYSS